MYPHRNSNPPYHQYSVPGTTAPPLPPRPADAPIQPPPLPPRSPGFPPPPQRASHIQPAATLSPSSYSYASSSVDGLSNSFSHLSTSQNPNYYPPPQTQSSHAYGTHPPGPPSSNQPAFQTSQQYQTPSLIQYTLPTTCPIPPPPSQRFEAYPQVPVPAPYYPPSSARQETPAYTSPQVVFPAPPPPPKEVPAPQQHQQQRTSYYASPTRESVPYYPPPPPSIRTPDQVEQQSLAPHSSQWPSPIPVPTVPESIHSYQAPLNSAVELMAEPTTSLPPPISGKPPSAQSPTPENFHSRYHQEPSIPQNNAPIYQTVPTPQPQSATQEIPSQHVSAQPEINRPPEESSTSVVQPLNTIPTQQPPGLAAIEQDQRSSYSSGPVPSYQNYDPQHTEPIHNPPLDVVIRVEDLAPPLQGSREVIRQCTYPDGVKYRFLWYFPRDAPNFFACSNCYYNRIRGTKFHDRFDSGMNTGGGMIYCHFATPHAKNLWGKALEHDDFNIIKPFMESRMTVQPCQGTVGVKATAKIKWYDLNAGEIPGFVSCEACFEDIILATNFSTKFKPCELVQGENDTWSCDMAIKSMPQALQDYSERNDWHGFVSAATHRMSLPVCAAYKMVPHDSRVWYQPKSHLPNYVICETCYLDTIKYSDMALNFKKRPDHLVQERSEWICTMGYMGMTVTWPEAKWWKNFRLWFENARIFMENPLCSGQGIKNAKWYTFKNGFDNFDLCPSCYSCLIATFGFGIYLKETTYPPEMERACDFYPARYRFQTYMDKLSEAINVNEFSIFQDEIVATSHLQECPRTNAVAGRPHWYGMDEWLACGECYLAAIKGTKLDPKLKFHDAIATKERRCDLYSPRMRRLWTEACEKDDLEGFTRLAVERADMYFHTIVQCKQILSQQRLALERQKYLNAQSSFYNFMDGMQGPGINFTGYIQPTYTYGAADVGYGFNSSFGVDGARLGKQARDIVTGSMGATAKIRMLEKIWTEFE